ncbi:hypothetical protein AVEN_240585-1 [Araneus ventricosus]|uniref:Uncharacterized protein n=1 Tax=Araneus ventricosus TaxID=182803 RepID=A0A4Y2H2V0_ARAVE|nr:hypothetical protein AVEN_240585-1 [Araneus ventricosus]
MAFLAEAQKVDLLTLAAEVGLDVTVSSLELIKSIQSSADYEEETFKDILKAATLARILKEKEQKERKLVAKEKKIEKMEFLLKKMELESQTGERVKSSFDVHHLIPNFDPKVVDISLYLALIRTTNEESKR